MRHRCALAVATLIIGMAFAQSSSRPKAAGEPAALIGVSVFRDPGFALAGAEVQLAPAVEGNSKGKMKKLKGSSDSRGEFVFRVPPGPAEYKVSVSAKGLKAQEKSVSVQGEERVDVTFMLEPESK